MTARERPVVEDHGAQQHQMTSTGRSDAPRVPLPADTRGQHGGERPLRIEYPALNILALSDPTRPGRAFIIDGFLPESTVVSVVARSEAGKSTLARSLAFAICLGWETFGGLPVLGQRRALYMDLENGEDTWAEEFSDACLSVEQRTALAERLFIVAISPPPLDTAEGGQVLLKVAHEYDLSRGDLVILDSAQRIISGDENAARTWQDFYRHTATQLVHAGFTVLLLDNTGKNVRKGARGSSSKLDQVDVEWTLTRHARKVDLKRTKSRASGVRPHLALERLDNGEGYRYFDIAAAAKVAERAKARADAQVIIDAGLWVPGAQLPSHRDLMSLTKQYGLGATPAGSATPTGWGGPRVTAVLAELRKLAETGASDA